MPEPCDLVIVGAGGLGRQTAQAVSALPRWNLLGFVDEDLKDDVVDGLPVLGAAADVPDEARLVACAGPGEALSRIRMVRRLGLPAHRYAAIVHPAAWVAPSSRVGPGSVVLPHASLTASVRVGSHVAVMSNVTVGPDGMVEDFVTIASGVSVGGGVRLGFGASLGAGAVIGDGVCVGAGAVVGPGAVVLDDVPPGEPVTATAPARAPA